MVPTLSHERQGGSLLILTESMQLYPSRVALGVIIRTVCGAEVLTTGLPMYGLCKATPRGLQQIDSICSPWMWVRSSTIRRWKIGFSDQPLATEMLLLRLG